MESREPRHVRLDREIIAFNCLFLPFPLLRSFVMSQCGPCPYTLKSSQRGAVLFTMFQNWTVLSFHQERGKNYWNKYADYLGSLRHVSEEDDLPFAYFIEANEIQFRENSAMNISTWSGNHFYIKITGRWSLIEISNARNNALPTH